MKIVFLDIDGVLNSEDWVSRQVAKNIRVQSDRDWFDPEAVKRLNSLFVVVPSAKVVISSAWRCLHSMDELADLFKSVGLLGVEIIGMTGHDKEGVRGREIQAFLDTMPEAPTFVILDDDNDMEHLLPFLVQTSWANGLQITHVNDAIRRLGAE